MNKLDMKSENIAEDNIEYIKEKFPNVVVESEKGYAIDFNTLKQELSDVIIDDTKEKYQLTWPGKKEAIITANTPTTKTLRPVREKSVNFDATENIYIEGDNLEALKILQESYLGKIKCIYIDPPYNTGNDFIYNDNFNKNSNQELLDSGQIDEDGNRLVANNQSNGRFHSDWLSMMYPRLKLARNLLTEDGLIFISINDIEIDNLSKICNEIFGESNFIENYIWESTFRPDNSSPINRKNAEFILCYAKNKQKIVKLIGGKSVSDGMPSLTKNSMKKSTLHFKGNSVLTFLKDGVYLKGEKDGYYLHNDVEVKNGKIINDFSLTGRVIWGQAYLNDQIKKGTQIIIKNESFIPYTKKIEPTIQSPNKLLPKNIVGDVLKANVERENLFNKKVFDYPKPTTLIKYLASFIDDKRFIVLDFFSGSATTADAIMQLNVEDGGNRKYIMIQLPEFCGVDTIAYKDGYKTICDIGEERIRRSAKKIKEETKADIDYGFRVYKIDSSNMKDVYYKPSDLNQEQLNMFETNIKDDRTSEDLLTQVILDLGLTLDLKIEEKNILNNIVYFVDENSLIACFDDNIDINITNEICKFAPLKVVFKDSSFKNDNDKINVEERIKKLSPETEVNIL